MERNMNNINKTLYIPLYGKAYVSKKGIILRDEMAEKIWDAEGFSLKGKSKSKWLAYYMGIRSAVFDRWLGAKMDEDKGATVIHIGCGMDSRIVRVGNRGHLWYDVDFPEVIAERRKYFSEGDGYTMLSGDASEPKWLDSIPGDNAIVVMEGISMYLSADEITKLLEAIGNRFNQVALLMDAYSVFAAKMSKIKNPINDVGVTDVHGIDDPMGIANRTSLSFVGECNMTPEDLIDQLHGMEKNIFKKLYAGKMARKLYKLYEYKKG